MTSITQAYKLAAKDAAQYRRTKFVLVRTRDDFGKMTVEHCPESGAPVLYGPLLKHGLATIVGSLSWDEASGQVTGYMDPEPKLDRAARADAEIANDYDAGQRQAMAGLDGLADMLLSNGSGRVLDDERTAMLMHQDSKP